MKIFFLEPIEERLQDASWEASSIRESCWMKAENEGHARFLVGQITTRFYDRRDDAKPLYSPWLDSRLTTCAEASPSIEVPDGILVTAGGQTLS